MGESNFKIWMFDSGEFNRLQLREYSKKILLEYNSTFSDIFLQLE